MPERTNGGVFNDQVLTGSLKHYRIIGADFRGATDAENRPIHGSAAEIVFSEISRRATVAIMNPVTSDDGISFALETNRASWTIEALETLIRSLGTIGIDNVDVSNVEVERAAYDLISGGSSTFIGLDDTPADYAGFEDYYVVVNADGTGLEFVPGGTGSGVVTSVYGRDGDVDAQNGDYNSDQVTNNSSVTGGSVSDALEAIEEVAATAIQPNDNVSELVNDANYLTDITNESLGDLSDVDLTGAVDGQAIVFDGTNYVPQDVVNSYNGRVGDVVPVDNDYTTNMIENVSGVEGENTSEALENIDAIAQTALQPGDNVSELVNDVKYLINVVEDISPELGGDLHNNGFNIIVKDAGLGNDGIVFTGLDDIPRALISYDTSDDDFEVQTTVDMRFNSGPNDIEFINSGDFIIHELIYPKQDGTVNQVMSTDGDGTLGFSTVVYSFNGRDGFVIPVEGDYDIGMMGDVDTAGQRNRQVLEFNGSQWLPKDTVNTFNSRVGDVVPIEGDYTMTMLGDVDTAGIVNRQILEFDGSDFLPKDTVNTFNTRVGDVVPIEGDYDIGMMGDVNSDGANDRQVLEFDGNDWFPQDTVNTFNSRVGDIVPTDGDYTTDQITNDSTEATGATLTDALDSLSGRIDSNDTDISSLDDLKADKVIGAVENNFAGLDADGNLTDSSYNYDTFATAAQGDTADSAIQPGDDISELTNDANYINAGEAPVQSVAGKDGDVVLVEEDVTDLNRMRWMNKWAQTDYVKNDVVLDSPWTMIANKATNDRAAPQPFGPELYNTPEENNFINFADNSTVRSGVTITFTEGGWLRGIEANVPSIDPDVEYRVVINNITDPNIPKVTTIYNPELIEDQWVDVVSNNIVVLPGTEVEIYIEALNSSTSTVFDGQWTLNGEQDVPETQGWSRDKHEVLFISKTDLDGNDRGAALLSVVVGSTIQTTQTDDVGNTWIFDVTDTPIDHGDYVEYEVSRTTNDGNPDENVPTTITFNVPVAGATAFKSEVDYWTTVGQPAFATCEGLLSYNGVIQAGSETDAFGIRLEFQRAIISEDWDIVAFSGTGSSGSGDAGSEGTVLEAPIDGTPYSRQDETWLSAPTAAQGALADSAVQPGDAVSDLDNDANYINAGEAPVQSVFGRSGDVVALADDYNSTLITNESTVTGNNVTEAIDTLKSTTDSLASSKIDKFGGTNGNFAALSSGNLVDSGFDELSFATSTQGALADSAVQPLDNISDLTNDVGYITQDDIPNENSRYYTNFNGTDSYVALDTPWVPNGDFEISLTVSELTTGGGLLSGSNIGNDCIQIDVFGSNVRALAYVGSNLLELIAVGFTGTYIDISLVYTGTTVTLTANGVSNSGTWVLNGNQDIAYIGTMSTVNQFFGGEIFNVSCTDIVSLANSRYYPLDEPYGEEIAYDSAHANNGVYVNRIAEDVSEGLGGVLSIFGRTGNVIADISDYYDYYATKAQGTIADSALQPNDDISELTNDSGYLTDITSETLGDLSDVDTTGVVDGQLMTWDTDKFIATDIDGGEFIGEDVVVTSRSIPVKSNEIVTPENPNVGDQYFNTTLNKPLWWTGSAWVDSNGQAI